MHCPLIFMQFSKFLKKDFRKLTFSGLDSKIYLMINLTDTVYSQNST